MNWKILVGLAVIAGGLFAYGLIYHHATILTYTHSQELTREVLYESLELGKDFLITNQNEDGRRWDPS